MKFLKRVYHFVCGRMLHPLYEKTIGKSKRKKSLIEKYKIEKSRCNIVIFGSPNHGNLGDYAIFEAEKKLLSGYFPGHHIFDVNMTDFNKEIDTLASLLTKEDLLILTGGGNLGNQYMDDERIRRTVIETFPDNRIAMFPQTMFFTKDETGDREREKTARIYNAHKHLLLAARDEKSFADMKELFTGKVFLLPDVVLTWGSLKPMSKEGALMVLRSDLESALTGEAKPEIKKILGEAFDKVVETDTVLPVEIEMERFGIELQNKWRQFGQARLVVTDRLHGMIFASIAQTPCIVLGSYNHKLQETYKWVQDLGYVKFLSDWRELPKAVEELGQIKDCIYDMSSIMQCYEGFIKELS